MNAVVVAQVNDWTAPAHDIRWYNFASFSCTASTALLYASIPRGSGVNPSTACPASTQTG